MAEPDDSEVVRKERRTAWLSLAVAVMALGFVVFWLYRELGAPPDRVAAPFTRVGGPTRVATAVEVSRLWVGPRTDYVAVRANAPQERIWTAAECAMQGDGDGMPLPLLYLPRASSQEEFEQAVGRLGGERRRVSQCDPPSSAEPDWSVYCRGQTLPLGRERADCSHALQSTIVAVAAKSASDAPDLPLAFILAEKLSHENRRVSVLIVPPYLEADLELEDHLRSARTEVEGGVIVGGTTRIPDETRVKLRSVLVPRTSTAWVERLEKGLGSFEALLLALLTLFGVRQIPQVAPLLEGGTVAVQRWREKPRSDTDTKAGTTVTDRQERRGPFSTRTPSPSKPAAGPWERWKIQGARVSVTLHDDTTWTGTVDGPPEAVAGVLFLALGDAKSDDPETPSGPPGEREPGERRDLVLIRWDEVRRLSRHPVPQDEKGD